METEGFERIVEMWRNYILVDHAVKVNHKIVKQFYKLHRDFLKWINFREVPKLWLTCSG